MAPSRDRRPGYSRRAQYGLLATYVLAVAGAIVGAALLALATVRPAAFAALRLGVAEVTAPVAGLVARGAGAVASVPTAIGTWWNVHGQNDVLRAELKRLRPAAVEARLATTENRRLRALLRFRDRGRAVVAAARIVSTSASSTRRFGILNAGFWQRVAEGMPVVGPEGLVGRVLEAGPNTSRVLLVTDAESVVPVRRVRDGLPALAAGRGDGMVDLRTVGSADGRFRAGDDFVTSGIGGIYPPGILVARVVRPGADGVPAAPYARPSALDVALVLATFLPEPAPASAPRALPPAPPAAAPAPAPVPSPAPSPSPSAAASATPRP